MPLAKGLDLGTADNLRDPDSLSSGINCEQLITGEIVKRNGFVSVDTTTATPITATPVEGSVVVAENIASSSSLEFLDASGVLQAIYPSATIAPRVRNISAITETLIGTSSGFINYDVSYFGTTLLVAVAMSGGTEVRTYAFDSNLNLIQQGSDGYSSVSGLTGASVKVIGSNVFVFQSTANTIRIYNQNLSYSGTSLSLGGSLAWDVGAWSSSSNFIILYDNGASMTLAVYASSVSLTTSTTFSNTNVTRACVFPQTAGSTLVAFISRSAGTRLTAFRYNSSLVLQGTADLAYGTNTVYNITGIAPTGISNILFAVEYGTATAADVHERGVRCMYVSSSYTGTTSITEYGSNMIRLGLASKPVQFSSGDYPYFLISHQSIDSYNLQNCYGLMQFTDPSSFITTIGFCGKLSYGQAENFISRRSAASNVLPSFASISSTRKLAVSLTRSLTDLTTTAAASTFNLSFNDVTLDSYFQGSKPVRIGGYTALANNAVNLIDSASMNEAAFNLYPDKVVVADGGAGAIANGTYNYVAVFECFDNRGNLLESSTSEPTSYTNGAGNRTFSITCYGAGLLSRSSVRLSLYRTANGGTIYYKVASTVAVTLASYALTDNVSDSDLDSGKILYTTGGVAENIAPPNANFVAAVKNRLWTFETGNLDTLWFTKETREGLIPQFSDLLTINVGRSYGALVGTAALDDKVVVFKEFCVMVIVGDGPSENLIGGWSSPAVIFQGMGCISARSITETPQGVFFQSQEGIYLVDKGMNVSFVGRPLYKSEGTLISSAYNPVNNCVYFLSSTKLWAFFITTGSWYEWTVTNPVDILYESGVLYLITTTKILKQTAGTWQDDASNYQQLIKLGQFQFAGIQGFQRVYKILATGRSLADEAGTVTVKNYFDANTTATDTQTIAQTALVSGNKMSLEIRPSKQKCETMQIELSHTANNSGITINAVTAEVGAIPGAGRRASTGRAV
jgi:hypothetical protein